MDSEFFGRMVFNPLRVRINYNFDKGFWFSCLSIGNRLIYTKREDRIGKK